MDNTIEYILFGLLGFCGLALVIVALCGLFWVADNAFTGHCFVNGKIKEVSFYPEHTESYYNVALKMPMMRTIPDQWSVDLETAEGSDSLDLDEEPSRWIGKGKTVKVEYAKGRISGDFRAINISKP